MAIASTYRESNPKKKQRCITKEGAIEKTLILLKQYW